MKTGAVIVTFNPDLTQLSCAVNVILEQVDHLFIVDNGSQIRVSDSIQDGKIDSVSLGENRGIAAALNLGIERARSAGCKYVLLLDQDSTPPDNMVERFQEVFTHLASNGNRIAGIGPRHRDRRTGHLSRFIVFNWFHFRTRGKQEGGPAVCADFLISSGSFYDISVFDHVGLFDESLFIDHVDTEWFHRARCKGYRAFGVWDVVLTHSLGERSIPIWVLRDRVQPIHKPQRLYYVIRNSLLMYRMRHAPLKWITGDAVRLLRLIIIYTLFLPDRSASIAYICRGLVDGLKGISGPFGGMRST